ncbi:MAG TPA: AMP-binding protein [Streptosporangiaceae bacterium]
MTSAEQDEAGDEPVDEPVDEPDATGDAGHFYTPAYTFLRMWRPNHRPYGRTMQHGNRRPSPEPDSAGQARCDSTVTSTVFGAVTAHAARGAGRADRAALIDTTDGRALTYAELAAVVPTAAAGLARRGVLTGDVAAVHVPCARQLTLAVHALTAAGAVPAPIPRAGIASADDLAELLTAYDARMLVTAPPLGRIALDAADRSYVRQVFAFGDVPGATPFGELLRGGGPPPRIDPRRDHALIQPGLRLTHADRLAELDRLAAAVAVDAGDVLIGAAAGCPPATWVGLIDVALLRGATFVAVGRPGTAPLLRAIETYDATLAIVAPVTLRTLAQEAAVPPRPVRLLVAGPAPRDAVRACRDHDWSVGTLL